MENSFCVSADIFTLHIFQHVSLNLLKELCNKELVPNLVHVFSYLGFFLKVEYLTLDP